MFRRLNEELEEILEEMIPVEELKPTKIPSVFDIVRDGKKVGYLEFPDLEDDVENAIFEVEESYYRHGEYDTDEFNPSIEDIKILDVKVKEYDEINDTYGLDVKFSAVVNNEDETSTVEVYSEPRVCLQ